MAKSKHKEQREQIGQPDPIPPGGRPRSPVAGRRVAEAALAGVLGAVCASLLRSEPVPALFETRRRERVDAAGRVIGVGRVELEGRRAVRDQARARVDARPD